VSTPKKWVVYVDDNFHYMDEEERYTYGEFDTEEEAVTTAKRIVDDFLTEGYKPGMSAEELYSGYTMFGEDPWISGSKFSAWQYAKERCFEICNQ
jgi:hypothetical protein